MQIASFIFAALAAAVSLSTLLSLVRKSKERTHSEGAREARTEMSLDTIKLQNETLLAGNRVICDKLDNHNVRLSRMEQSISDAHLSEIPGRLAVVEQSAKSAHHRIDELAKKKGS